MNQELLDTLVAALRISPDNVVLRKEVVQGLLEARRWLDLQEHTRPLLDTEHRAFALFVLAKAAHESGNSTEARAYYRDAVELDKFLIDESFEAELAPENAIRLPASEFEADPPRFRPYAGPRLTFADVGGMEALKEQIRLNIMYPFSHPEIFAVYGKKIGGGILLYGPPGCGKTHIARATAGEIGANFFTMEINDILSMWMGESEKQLNLLFETARASAPAVIFIDEIDALGAKRNEINSTSIRMVVTQLLTEMDGIDSRNTELLILGATNEPWNVDAAFRRPGRFDRVLFVPPPDVAAREEVLKLHARGRKIDTKLPWSTIAERTDHFSGADLAALVDRATECALTDALKSGHLRDVGLHDVQKALRESRPSTRDWLRRAKNYVTYANQDGLYDDLARYIEATRPR